jgi:hypothetical protein
VSWILFFAGMFFCEALVSLVVAVGLLLEVIL